MEMTPVISSTVAARGYDPETEKLRIRFHTGNTYEYSNVTQEEYNSISSAVSVGAKLKSIVESKEYVKI